MPSHIIINGDCLTELERLPDNSVHLAILDLPYGNTALKWDKQIDLAKLWVQLKRVLLKRIKHDDGAVSNPGIALFFCMTRFKYEVYNSNPEWYRQDLVWVKSKKERLQNVVCGFCDKKVTLKEGDTVLDPTAGGGVVIEASLMHGRNVIAIELDKQHYEMCKARTKAVQPPLI